MLYFSGWGFFLFKTLNVYELISHISNLANSNLLAVRLPPFSSLSLLFPDLKRTGPCSEPITILDEFLATVAVLP